MKTYFSRLDHAHILGGCHKGKVAFESLFLVIRSLAVTVFFLFITQGANAQISQDLYQVLPDSLRPKNRHNLRIPEVQKILKNTFSINGWSRVQYDETDTLCLRFAPKYQSIRGKKEQIDYMFDVCEYLYNGLNHHTGNQSNRGITDSYQYPHLKIALEYCDMYIDLHNKNIGLASIGLARILEMKAAFFYSENLVKESHSLLQEALSVAKKTEDKHTLVHLYASLSHLFGTIDLCKHALVYSDSALAIVTSKKNNPQIHELTRYLYMLRQADYLSLFGHTSIPAYGDSSTMIHEKYGTKLDGTWNGRLIAFSYILQSGVAYYQKQYQKVLQNIDSAAIVFPNLRILEVWEMAMVYKAISLRKLSRFSESNKIIKQLDLDDVKRSHFALLIEVLHDEELAAGRYENAHKYSEQLRQFEKRRHSLDIQRKIIEMDQLYNLREQNQQIEQLKALQRRNQIIAGFAILTISLLVTLLIIRYRASLARTARLVGQINDATQIEILKLEAVREEERRRLGRELHDGLSSSIASIGNSLELMTVDCKDDMIKQKLSGIYKLVSGAYEMSRSKSHTWYHGSKECSEQLFLHQIQTLVNSALPDNHYIKKISVDQDTLDKIETESRIHFLRIIQEALTNVVKHAKARSVSILLYEDLNEIVLNIKDDGKGFSTTSSQSGKINLGLNSIRERTQEMNGDLEIISDSTGTEIIVSIPSIISESHF